MKAKISRLAQLIETSKNKNDLKDLLGSFEWKSGIPGMTECANRSVVQEFGHRIRLVVTGFHTFCLEAQRIGGITVTPATFEAILADV